MNIYQNVEVSARELDSRLLLAVLAASKGHNVMISDVGTIMEGVLSGALAPGIFHTNSQTPGAHKVARHQLLVDKGFRITSIDEEAGLTDYGYEKYAAVRYSDTTLEQASAVFGWGVEDTETIKRVYPKWANKIHQTGNPRADLWTARFKPYWQKMGMASDKPYLLVPSNMGLANNTRRFHEVVHADKSSANPHISEENSLMDFFGVIAEEYRMISAFIEAIRELAASNDGYDIIVRPHPAENIEAWEVYLNDLPNVYIIREGSITGWVNNAFAIMHNGCTTALEATISGKPVVTYLPIDQRYGRELPNQLGLCVDSPGAVVNAVNEIFGMSRSNEIPRLLPKSVAKKIYLDDAELAAQKIVKVWENLDNGELSEPCKWIRFQTPLQIARLKRGASWRASKLISYRVSPSNRNHKFPVINSTDLHDRINRLQHVLGLGKVLKWKLLSERAVLIQRRQGI